MVISTFKGTINELMSGNSDKILATRISNDELQQLPLTHQAIIPESYVDGMGHMNVMWYTHLFGHGIQCMFELIGMNRNYFEANHAGSFALK